MNEFICSDFQQALQGDALRDLFAMRRGQIDRGHSPLADLENQVCHLPDRIRVESGILYDRTQPGHCHNLAAARRSALRIAAMAWAAVERIDAEMVKKGGDV